MFTAESWLPLTGVGNGDGLFCGVCIGIIGVGWTEMSSSSAGGKEDPEAGIVESDGMGCEEADSWDSMKAT